MVWRRQQMPHASQGAAVLGLATAIAALYLAQVFVRPPRGELLAAVVLAHLAGRWRRRRRPGRTLVWPLVVAVLGTVILWERAPGIEGSWPGAIEQVARSVVRQWRAVPTMDAPVAATPELVLLGALVCAFAAAVGDIAAFGLRHRLVALVPSVVLFGLAGALNDGSDGTLAGGYALAMACFLLVTSPARPRGGSRLPFAVGQAAAAVLVAGVVSPLLPGADSAALLSWRSRSASTLSPLADIRGRLVAPDGTEMFTVRAAIPSYWRVRVLEEFDGVAWRPSEDERGPLPLGEPADDGAGEVPVQEITLGALTGPHLPAAYRPLRVEAGDEVRIAPGTDELVTDAGVGPGFTYLVASAPPGTDARIDADPKSAPLADADATRAVALPPLPERVVSLARRLTAPATDPIARARALEAWFRREFRYDLGARPGHGGDVLEEFLFTTRRGYCEQFAAAYAVLARAAGLPARVAVGFTAGDLGTDGRYHVLDSHAHAWPEVHLPGRGWVAFEPTPGRETGVRANGGPRLSLVHADPPRGRTPAAGVALGIAVTLVAAAVLRQHRHPRSGKESDLLALSPPVATTAPASGNARVLRAWATAVAALATAGARREPHETAMELAERARAAGVLSARSEALLADLAAKVTAASFSPEPVDPDGAAVAERAATHLRRELASLLPPPRSVGRRTSTRSSRLAPLGCRAGDATLHGAGSRVGDPPEGAPGHGGPAGLRGARGQRGRAIGLRLNR
jgi:transglutaminase-like putative cysteine protease